MACPFFMPGERDETRRWVHAPRLPLGAHFRGTCRARPEEMFESGGDACNCGYAGGVCDRFPADAPADAVRFSTDGETLVYVLERAHVPVEHGIFDESVAGEILAAQARAFLAGAGGPTPYTCT